MFNTPKFWQQKSLIAIILLPLSLIFQLIWFYKKFTIKTNKVKAKVISIGNLNMGGAGKTPTAIAINNIIQNLGYKTAFVSRGYGRKSKEIIKVQQNSTSDEVGDEPQILAKQAPTWVYHRRDIAAINAINNDNAEIIIMDDGLQHLYLHKDLSFLVIDSNYAFGNGLLFPAGPLRESINLSKKHVDAVIIIGSQNHYLKEIYQDKSIFYAKKILSCDIDLSGQKIIAFSALGNNENFFTSLSDNFATIELIEKFSFPDHHAYTIREIENIINIAKTQNAKIITTEKDFLKIPIEFQADINYVNLHLEFDNLHGLEMFIKHYL